MLAPASNKSASVKTPKRCGLSALSDLSDTMIPTCVAEGPMENLVAMSWRKRIILGQLLFSSVGLKL